MNHRAASKTATPKNRAANCGVFIRELKKSRFVIARSVSDEAISIFERKNRDCFAPFGRSQ
jgi:hypothetical protein